MCSKFQLEWRKDGAAPEIRNILEVIGGKLTFDNKKQQKTTNSIKRREKFQLEWRKDGATPEITVFFSLE